MLHPNQFKVNEAWIVFRLNDAPLRTEQDGLFNCVCLMDAASCFILGNVFVALDQLFGGLLEKGWAHHQEFPATLLVPTGQYPTNVPEEAERHGIAVKRVKEGELIPFIREARLGFKHYEATKRALDN